MASVAIPIDDPRQWPPESKPMRSPKSKGGYMKHKTRSPADTVRKSEQSLHQLLEDFESGRLNAFGSSDMLQKMQEIREMQEKLTLKHFEIDQMRISQESQAGPSEEKVDSSLRELTQALEKLGSSIQSLHSGGGEASGVGGGAKGGLAAQDSARRQKRVHISSEPPSAHSPVGTEGQTTPL